MFVLCVVFMVNVGRVSVFVRVGIVCVFLCVCWGVCGGCLRSVLICVSGCFVVVCVFCFFVGLEVCVSLVCLWFVCVACVFGCV